MGVRAAWLVMAAACGEPPVIERGSSFEASGIFNGRSADDGVGQSVVALLYGQGSTGCSGVLIAPAFVLTAAHCVQGEAPTAVAFGASVSTAERRPIRRISLHPDYESLEVDLAALELASPAPDGHAPAELDRRDPALNDADAGAPLRLVGFGRDESGASGVRRSFTTSIEMVCGGSEWCRYRQTYDVEPYRVVATQDQGGACFGDSGGGAFSERRGASYLSGIVAGARPKEPNLPCGGIGTSVLLEPFADSIEEFMAGGELTPCEVCDEGCAAARSAWCWLAVLALRRRRLPR